MNPVRPNQIGEAPRHGHPRPGSRFARGCLPARINQHRRARGARTCPLTRLKSASRRRRGRHPPGRRHGERNGTVVPRGAAIRAASIGHRATCLINRGLSTKARKKKNSRIARGSDSAYRWKSLQHTYFFRHCERRTECSCEFLQLFQNPVSV